MSGYQRITNSGLQWVSTGDSSKSTTVTPTTKTTVPTTRTQQPSQTTQPTQNTSGSIYDQNPLWLRPNETPEQYKARVAILQGGSQKTTQQPATSPTVIKSAAPVTQTYTVASGDSLSRIAQQHGTTWQELYELNKGTIGPDPNLIRPGQVLNLPGQQGQIIGQIDQAPQDQPTQTTDQPSNYTGPSIVDYLKSIGQPSDFNSRAKMAQQYGIANYTGTAQQNTQLLNTLKGSQAGQQTPTDQFQDTIDMGVDENIGEPTGEPTGEEIGESTGEEIGDDLGLQDAQSVDDIITRVADAFGLDDIKNEIKVLDDAYAEDIMKINDNPWLSEGERSKQTKLRQEQYETNKNALYERWREQNKLVDKALSLWEAQEDRKHDMYVKQMDQQFQLVRDANLREHQEMLRMLDAEIDSLKSAGKYQESLALAQEKAMLDSLLQQEKFSSQAEIERIKASLSGKESGLTKEEEQFNKDKNDFLKKIASADMAYETAYNLMATMYGFKNPELIKTLTREEIMAYGGNPRIEKTLLDIILSKSKWQ